MNGYNAIRSVERSKLYDVLKYLSAEKAEVEAQKIYTKANSK